jgi:hypothetical protein
MKRFLPGDFLWLALLASVTLFFIFPSTNHVFINLTNSHPLLMGFLKFAILATMGEVLVLRLSAGVWKAPPGLAARMVVWGLIGIAITFMFSFFSAGVTAMVEKGYLPAGSGMAGAFLKAFYTSAIMNLTFGPVFMAAHRLSDTYIDMRVLGSKPSAKEVAGAINWPGFIDFVVAKTIPFWWIPAHTITFMLPGEYRVLAAAYLSIVLGIILVYARGIKTES